MPPGADGAPAPGSARDLSLRAKGIRERGLMAAFARLDQSWLDPVGGNWESGSRGSGKGRKKVLLLQDEYLCVQPPCCGRNETEVDDATWERIKQHERE